MRRVAVVGAVAVLLCLATPARADAGDMDPSFGNGGTKVFDMGTQSGWEVVNSVHVLRSGRLLVGGTYGRHYPYDGLVLARLQPWGGLDQSFGSGGRVKVATTDFVWGDSVVQPDGKILVGGADMIGDQRRAVVRRFTTSGALDRQFGVQGVAVVTLLGVDVWAPRLALTSTGAIIVATQDDTASLRLTRLTSSGVIDASFGSGGVARFEPPEGLPYVSLQRIWVTSSGAIVVGSMLNSNCGEIDCSFWRTGVFQLQSDGTPDPTFAGGGYAVIAAEAYDRLAAGPGGTVYVADLRHLFRLGADGVPDPTFGGAGFVPLAHPGTVDVAPDGRVVVAGEQTVSRFLPDGTPDASFGGGDGVAAYGLPQGTNVYAAAVDVQPDGRIVVGTMKPNYAPEPDSSEAVLFRLLG